MGPWLPKNFIVANALNTDRGNPFRGRSRRRRRWPPVQYGSAVRQRAAHRDPLPHRRPDRNPTALALSIPTPAPGELTFATVDLLDLLLNRVLTAPDDVLLDLRGWPTVVGAVDSLPHR
jgi:hypothetical protein